MWVHEQGFNELLGYKKEYAGNRQYRSRDDSIQPGLIDNSFIVTTEEQSAMRQIYISERMRFNLE